MRDRSPRRAALAMRARRIFHDPVFAGAFLVFGVLLAGWPFVHSPSLSVGAAWAYLFGLWTALVLMLFAVSRSVGRGGGAGHG